MAANEDSVLSAHLTEFEKLKDEIKSRSNVQSTLINLNLTAIAAIGGFVLAHKEQAFVAVILTIVSPVLGLLFLDHDTNIKSIGTYIRDNLSPAIRSLVGVPSIFGYEDAVTLMERNVLQRFSFGIAIVFIFGAVPVFSLAVSFPEAGKHAWSLFVFFIGAVLTLMFLLAFLTFFLKPFQATRQSKRV
jgi:hypothetical protein